jgi:hypothetical protein
MLLEFLISWTRRITSVGIPCSQVTFKMVYIYNEALRFFCGLRDANLKLDEFSLISILAASGRLGYLLNGKEIHAYEEWA